MNGAAEAFRVLVAKDLCNHDPRADANPSENANKTGNQQTAGPYCGRCGLVDEVPDKKQIDRVAELLDKRASQ